LRRAVPERRSPALGHVVPASAATAERARGRGHERPGREAARPRRVVDGDHDRGPVGRHPGDHHDTGHAGDIARTRVLETWFEGKEVYVKAAQ